MGEEGRDEAASSGLEVPARIHRSVEVIHEEGRNLQVQGGNHHSDLSSEGRGGGSLSSGAYTERGEGSWGRPSRGGMRTA